MGWTAREAEDRPCMAPTQNPVSSVLTELDLHHILSGRSVPYMASMDVSLWSPGNSPIESRLCALTVTRVQTQMLSHSASNTRAETTQ